MHSAKFFVDPNVDQFKDIQKRARLSPNYDPFCVELASIERNIADANPVETLQRLDDLEEVHQACPRFHYVEARVYELLGEEEAMQAAIDRLQTCLKMIAETGDGTRESPYSIAFITDQDDLLRAFGEQKRCQQSVNSTNRQYDVLVAHSGEEFWFDVTDIAKRRFSLRSTEMASG